MRERDAARQRLYAQWNAIQVLAAPALVFGIVALLFLAIKGRVDWAQTAVIAALVLGTILVARFRYR